MRKDLAFTSKGTRCVGYMYVPDSATPARKHPSIVMAHGFSAVKEMYFTHVAEYFCQHGFVMVLFDYRFLGGSDGEPRGQIFPWQQIEDSGNAITFATLQPEVDTGRLGIFGSSYNGGHVICVGAVDRWVKCVVSQVPLIDGLTDFRAIASRETAAALIQFLEADRLERYTTGAVNYLAVVTADGNCVLPRREAYEWLTQTQQEMAPAWENRVTVESIEKFLEYSPATFLPRVSPTPLLLMVAAEDTIAPTDLAIAVFEEAHHPKNLVIMPGGHFEAYTIQRGPYARQATEWFTQHLLP
jgi:cephalosporin-C deacetylase-like acetyl esterase